MRVGSMFSGIGGFDLGLEAAGMTVAWQAEIDPYASRILRRRWPDVPNLGNVALIDWSDPRYGVDLICAGFPCQPVSVAGAQLAQRDDRWLWPEVARAVAGTRPRWVLLENVPGLLYVPGAFDEVLSDLARLGFDAEWESLPASSVGAPHLRHRVFVVAYPSSSRRQEHGRARPGQAELGQPERRGETLVADALREGPAHGRQGAERRGELGGRLGDDPAAGDSGREVFARLRLGDCGWWATEPDVGRVAHGVPRRVDRLRCLGNAIVPPLAEALGRMILDAEGTLAPPTSQEARRGA